MRTSWANYPAHGEYAKELAPEGYSASQIAKLVNKRFGSSYSRSAVIGFLHRTGTNLQAKPSQFTNANKVRAAKLKRAKETIVRVRPTRALVQEQAAGFELYGPIGDFPASGQCKFIPGESTARDQDGKPAFQCCGFPTGDLARHPEGDITCSWCDAHLTIVKGPSGATYSGASHNPELNRPSTSSFGAKLAA